MSARRHGQDENRRRRRLGKITENGAVFSAVAEIGAAGMPLAARATYVQAPLRLRRWVLDYADAAHEFVGTISGWLAEADALARTTHLADQPGARRYAVTTLVDLAQRPALPEITDAMMARAVPGSGHDIARRGRGRPKSEAPKRQVTLRLDGDVIAAMRASGQGWQARANAVPRERFKA